jgi:hypothetical protein
MKLPNKKGNLDIYPAIHHGNVPSVTIIGDPKGLRYLADLLHAVADEDQNKTSAPDGTREHIHIHPEQQLGEHSCEVEICRADAKGTKELPDFMK